MTLAAISDVLGDEDDDDVDADDDAEDADSVEPLLRTGSGN